MRVLQPPFGCECLPVGPPRICEWVYIIKKIKETINIYIYISAEDGSRYNEGGKVEDISYSLD